MFGKGRKTVKVLFRAQNLCVKIYTNFVSCQVRLYEESTIFPHLIRRFRQEFLLQADGFLLCIIRADILTIIGDAFRDPFHVRFNLESGQVFRFHDKAFVQNNRRTIHIDRNFYSIRLAVHFARADYLRLPFAYGGKRTTFRLHNRRVLAFPFRIFCNRNLIVFIRRQLSKHVRHVPIVRRKRGQIDLVAVLIKTDIFTYNQGHLAILLDGYLDGFEIHVSVPFHRSNQLGFPFRKRRNHRRIPRLCNGNDVRRRIPVNRPNEDGLVDIFSDCFKRVALADANGDRFLIDGNQRVRHDLYNIFRRCGRIKIARAIVFRLLLGFGATYKT